MEEPCIYKEEGREKKGFSLGEFIILLVIITALISSVLDVVGPCRLGAPLASMRDRGVGFYKALYAASTAEEFGRLRDGLQMTNQFSTSTEYFKFLVEEGVLDTDYSIFAGPGQEKAQTTDPEKFNAENNGWSIVLCDNGDAHLPLFVSRNLFPEWNTFTLDNLPSNAAVLGEGKKTPGRLKFNQEGGIVITRIGAGNIYKIKDLGALFPPPGSTNRVVILHP